MKIGELPFRERPILELLHFEDDRVEVDRNWAGYGWARAPRIWVVDTPIASPSLAGARSDALARRRSIDDALVLALHSADDGEPLPDDIELEFELPDGAPVTALASQFLAVWLPKLPQASAIVLALCNPHHATLRYPAGARAPVFIASDDVESWIDDDEGGRLELRTPGTWARLGA